MVIRGDVFWTDLKPRSGSEQSGRRPAVVVSRDAMNRVDEWQSILMVPLSTSARQAGRGPTAILVPRGSAGLTRESVALCHQVTTVDRSKLLKRIGTLPADVLRQIETGLRCALALE
jgi:mRNA interferase MazF